MSASPQYFAITQDKQRNRVSIKRNSGRLSKDEAQDIRRTLRGMSVIDAVKRFDCHHGELIVHFHGEWRPENAAIVVKVVASCEADIVRRSHNDRHRADTRRIRRKRRDKSVQAVPRSELHDHFAIAVLEGDLAEGAAF